MALPSFSAQHVDAHMLDSMRELMSPIEIPKRELSDFKVTGLGV
jgi:hypothetical protein